MNFIEKFVYDLLKSSPSLKIKIRNLYQDIFSSLIHPEEIINGNLICNEGYYFGFHDITPFSADDQLVLANKILIPLRMPNKFEKLGIGYFHGEGYKEFKLLDYSTAWNWHKGCRLQWVNDKDQLIFNSFSKTLVSRIVDIDGKLLDEIDFPIDTVATKRRIAASFDYHRLEHLMPGYGYRSYSSAFQLNEIAPSNTGIFIIDLKKKTKELLIDLQELSSSWLEIDNNELYHFVTHTLFSPDNRYLAFLHRAVNPNHLFTRMSRLVVYDFKNNSFHFSPTSGMVSHYNFDKKNNIIAYCQINNKDGHYLFSNPKFSNYQLIRNDILNSDGHQYFSSVTENVFISDTYPDRYRYSKIYLVDIPNNNVKCKLYIKSPRKFRPPNINKHWSCDLHPRMANRTNTICFDSTHTGKRSLCILM